MDGHNGSILNDKQLLGHILRGTDACARADWMRKMTDPRDQAIFDAMYAEWTRGSPVDVTTVREQLSRSGHLGRNGVTDKYLLNLIDFIPTEVSSQTQPSTILAELVAILDPTARMPVPGKDGHETFYADIDAKKARVLLATNASNQRRIRRHHCRTIERARQVGRYRWTGDPMHLDLNGRLINGQHRLTAIANTGIAIRDQLVHIGLSEDAINSIDTGAKARTVGDAFHMRSGRAIMNSVVAAIVLEACEFDVPLRQSATKADQVDFVRQCQFLDDLSAMRINGRATAGVLAAALRCMRRDRVLAIQFFTNALRNNHEMDGEKCVALQLMATLVATTRVSHGSGLQESIDLAAKCIRAWNAFRTGKDIKLLKAVGEFPEAI